MATINPRHVFWLAPLLAKGDFRPYLHGIIIEPQAKGCLLIATDGHVMGIVHDPKAKAKKRFMWRPSRALIARGKVADRIKEDRQERLVEAFGEDMGAVAIDPHKAHANIGVPVATTKFKFNPQLLARFKNVFGDNGAVLQSTGETEPAIITHPARPNFYGLIMPMRIPDPDGAPKWLPKPKKAKVSAKKRARK